MTQGESISLLLRVHKQSGRDRYLDVAADALKVFFHPVEDGGVATYPRGELVVFEEVPNPRPYSHILNGWIYALWGVYDFARYTQDGDAQRIYLQSLHSLKSMIELYDTGYWSRYDLFPSHLSNVASPFYHPFHIALLEGLYITSGVEEFRTVALRWRSYQQSRLSTIRSFYMKALHRMVYGGL
jgi:hypothetical protein